MKLVKSFKYAIEGVISSFKSERNMKIHLLIMLIVIILGFILKINTAEWIICIVLFGLVIAGELFNTAIETTIDLITKEQNEKAKLAKDISAGAVLILAISSIIIGLIIFVPKILNIL